MPMMESRRLLKWLLVSMSAAALVYAKLVLTAAALVLGAAICRPQDVPCGRRRSSGIVGSDEAQELLFGKDPYDDSAWVDDVDISPSIGAIPASVGAWNDINCDDLSLPNTTEPCVAGDVRSRHSDLAKPAKVPAYLKPWADKAEAEGVNKKTRLCWADAEEYATTDCRPSRTGETQQALDAEHIADSRHQVFVGGYSYSVTDEVLKNFFSRRCGEVASVRQLRFPYGDSKGVCFISFRREEAMQKALGFHNKAPEELISNPSRWIVVREAESTFEKAGKGKKYTACHICGMDGHFARDCDQQSAAGKAYTACHHCGMEGHFSRDCDQKRAAGAGPSTRTEDVHSLVDRLVEEVCTDCTTGTLRPGDFNLNSRRTLEKFQVHDLAAGTSRCKDALEMVRSHMSGKDRKSVGNWKGYVLTLLKHFDEPLHEELSGDNRGGSYANHKAPKSRLKPPSKAGGDDWPANERW